MLINNTHLRTSLQMSGCSLLLAATSIMLSQQINYLNHMFLFNTMTLMMLSIAIAALLIGLLGTWRTKGRNAKLWLADVLALFVVAFYVFNP